MGWLYMKSLNGHAGPREYLDAQFTFERSDGVSKVLRSELVGNSVYYAAVEQTILETGAHEVFALICLVAYDPRDREGYIFGYKDIVEGMGPYESNCPVAILDLLTPTDRPYALQWRALPRERRWRSRGRGNCATRRGLQRIEGEEGREGLSRWERERAPDGSSPFPLS